VAKKRKSIVKLSGKGTNYYYTTVVGKKEDTKGKLRRSKYDPFTRKHIIFIEKKLR
jgi:ribosomal protein L33